MWQVWSVSANIAAYASEGAKASQRAPRKSEVEKAAKELKQITRNDGSDHSVTNLTAAAPSLSLFTSGRQNPQATLEQARHAYEEDWGASD
ncbi:hypothetical protein [Agrobacterium larrymoorei]|uniref:Uncharacterized protein n=1 Tax=Agrobacterium larrymoorei TaxID=160699 RepID=A0AAJ2EV88_9HYPH|nr:hypothetical protein [Agrobacterium larrymoorei]MDQ1186076.1 hypothetical protein [Agrobacterium larrymoorei]MDR6102297.1 hypothetical protein [Agrobacterium larrymoorei]